MRDLDQKVVKIKLQHPNKVDPTQSQKNPPKKVAKNLP